MVFASVWLQVRTSRSSMCGGKAEVGVGTYRRYIHEWEKGRKN
jgi:hypothetical protein